MKRWLLSLVVLGSSPALAKSLILDMRGDLDSESYNNEARTAGESNSSRFNLHTARIDFRGDLNESISYRFRTRLNNESTATGLDSLSNRVDFAMLTHKMGDLSLSFGKFTTDVGGHETIGDSRDVYFKSEANKALTGTYKSILGANPGNVFYQTKYDTGVKATYKIGEGDVSLIGANNPEADSAANPNSHNRFMMGAVWKGKFAEGSLQPVLSYHTYKTTMDNTSTAQTKAESKLMAAGLKWTENGHYAQMDYVQLDASDLSLNGTTADFQVQSVVAEGGYKWENWMAKLKAEMSKVSETPEAMDKVTQDVMGYGVIVEHMPYPNDKFRYHLALTQKDYKMKNAPTQTENHILLGLAFAADFLK